MDKTYIPDWSLYVTSEAKKQAQISAGDYLTINTTNGWISGSWGRQRCTGCIVDDEDVSVIVWDQAEVSHVKYDASETDYQPGCNQFYIKYNDKKVFFKAI